MSDSATSTNGATPAAAPPAPPVEGAAVDLQTLIQTVHRQAEQIGDLARGLGKVKDLVPGARPKNEGESKAQGPAPTDDLNVAMRLGRVMATLSPAQQAHIEAAQAEGLTYKEALRLADAMLVESKSAPPPATGGAPTAGASATDDAGTGRNAQGAVNRAPPGVAATAASRSAVAHPRTQKEFIQICRSDPVRAKQLRDDTGFVLSDLPQV